MVRLLGWRSAATYVWWKVVGRRSRREIVSLHPRRAQHPVLARVNSSDLDVFGTVFSGGEYAPLDDEDDVAFVIDGGSNVGYSAAWFLSTFPDAVVCSIEPDSDNVAMLRRNLAPYGDRAVIMQAALWSEPTMLEVVGGYRDGREWSRQVKRSTGGGLNAVPAVTVAQVRDELGFQRISILKLDIEGAEAELFKCSGTWIDSVDVLVAELHDDAGFGNASELFHAAIGSCDMTVEHSAELVIARRRGQPEP